MKRLAAGFALALLALVPTLPALAADGFVQDGASMFSPSAVSTLNQEIGDFQAQTGKEVLVITVPSLNGATVQAAAQTAASSQKLNGVMIYVSKGDRSAIVLPGTSEVSSGWFPAETTTAIRESMMGPFKAEDYDGGITTAVTGILNIYRSHLSSLPGAGGAANTSGSYARNYTSHSSGGHFSIMWIVFIIIGFFVLRSIMRNMGGRNYGPGGYGGGPGGPGYGGYGGGYGGGGGGFWSGMLGGLGGAFIGNELFGNQGGGFMGGGGAGGGGNIDPTGGDSGAGWANDAGQTNMGGSSSGDWGGGGFGDFGGGGGGGDFGGGGDSGGGW